jgi:porin
MAAYNGDPTPVDANGDPTNQHGIDFGWRSVFSIVEWEGRWDRIGSTPGRLPGVLKVGAWHHSGEFDDLHRDADGRSLADPASSGQARVHEGNFGAYLVAETLLVREEPPAERDPAATSAEEASVQGLGWFGRFGGAPGDRSAFEYYAESGLTYAGLFPGRDEDVFGVGCGYGQIGHGWRGRELDAVGWGAAGIVPPDYEIVTEVSYRAVFKRGLMIQPTVAWVVHPGGSAALEDALVLGLRARVDL